MSEDHDSDISKAALTVLRQNPLKAALTKHAIRGFRMAKVFADNQAAITSVDFGASGTHCITTSSDESLRIYDCSRGVREQVLYSKKYGCNLAQFTSQPGCVAYASTKLNDTIRYLSYETNQYIRYFVGHKEFVTSLDRSPVGGMAAVMSAALDGTVNIWDLNAVRPASTAVPACKSGSSARDGGIVAAYDPSGMVIAAAVASSEVQLFDVREVARGPFKTAPI
ncbi:WD40 repeat-like protein, partial [Martensiomyces pterosporus]